MALRKLPRIEAFTPTFPVDWEPPTETARLWHPVKAAHEDERSINIYGYIGEDPFSESGGVTERLISAALRRMGKGPVTLNINSKGGDYFAGVAIYNMLREHDGKVTARVMSLAASAASIIAMASDTLQIGKAASLMIHNSHGLVMGNANDMREAADVFAKFDAAMAGVYSDRSGIARNKIADYMDAATFFAGEEAVRLGLADELLASDQIADSKEPAAMAALRRLDVELAQKGIPRAERRALLSQVNGGTPGATSNVTPCADDETIFAILRRGLN
jgi:ATP-dependent protease ClpP protease subunit